MRLDGLATQVCVARFVSFWTAVTTNVAPRALWEGHPNADAVIRTLRREKGSMQQPFDYGWLSPAASPSLVKGERNGCRSFGEFRHGNSGQTRKAEPDGHPPRRHRYACLALMWGRRIHQVKTALALIEATFLWGFLWGRGFRERLRL